MKAILFYLQHGDRGVNGSRHNLDVRGVLWHILSRTAWSG